MYAPITRILLRYGVGILAGSQIGDMLASDRDVVDIISAGIAVAAAVVTERWYAYAKKHKLET
jgi:predicted MFS family arabinose efflux permease